MCSLGLINKVCVLIFAPQNRSFYVFGVFVDSREGGTVRSIIDHYAPIWTAAKSKKIENGGRAHSFNNTQIETQRTPFFISIKQNRDDLVECISGIVCSRVDRSNKFSGKRHPQCWIMQRQTTNHHVALFTKGIINLYAKHFKNVPYYHQKRKYYVDLLLNWT